MIQSSHASIYLPQHCIEFLNDNFYAYGKVSKKAKKSMTCPNKASFLSGKLKTNIMTGHLGPSMMYLLFVCLKRLPDSYSNVLEPLG